MNDKANVAVRKISRIAIATALASASCLLPVSVSAADKSALFKCVDPTGVTSIQSEPCPKGSTQAWRRDASPERPPTPDQAAQAEAKRLRDQQTVRELSEIVERRSRPAPPEPVLEEKPKVEAAKPPTACEAAQEFSASVRDKQWLALTDEQMQRIFRWVTEQCKLTPGASE